MSITELHGMLSAFLSKAFCVRVVVVAATITALMDMLKIDLSHRGHLTGSPGNVLFRRHRTKARRGLGVSA